MAHPDDEVLGCGASIYKWTKNGDVVDVCIMCTEAKARAFRPEDKELDDDLNLSSDFLGISQKFEGTFPNIEMNTVPHLQLVQHIEKAILDSQPDIVITHHPADTNNDHLQTSMACWQIFCHQHLALRCPRTCLSAYCGNGVGGKRMSGNTNSATRKVCGVLFGVECGGIC